MCLGLQRKWVLEKAEVTRTLRMHTSNEQQPGQAYYSGKARRQTSKRQTTSELAEHHHYLDWYGITRHSEGCGGQSRLEEDHPRVVNPCIKED